MARLRIRTGRRGPGLSGKRPGRLRRLLIGLAALLVGAAALPSAAQIHPDDLLPVEEAFALSAEVRDGKAEFHWDIADGYYLYRHAFRFEAITDGLELGEPEIPPGIPDHDEFFGDIESYRDQVTVRVPLARVPDGAGFQVRVASQGCADLGVCYPPTRQVVALDAGAPAARAVQDSGQDFGQNIGQNIGQDIGQDSGQVLSDRLRGIGRGLSDLTGRDEPLPPEQAFGLEALAVDGATILVRFDVHDGYYLYRDSLEFRLEDSQARIVRASLPEAEPVHDEFFGDTHAWFGLVEIPLHLSRPAGPAEAARLSVDFQGCQVDGICYPPMVRSLAVDLLPASAPIRPDEEAAPLRAGAPTAPISEQDRLAGALAGSPALAMLLFFVAGLLLAFTPCVFPMVPILSGLIAGEGDRITTGRAFRLSVVYVLAMALVYTAFGVIAALLGQNLQAAFQHPVVLGGFAALFVLLSLAMFGFYELQLPASWQTRLNRMSNRAEGGTLWGAAIMGALSALVVGPCVAPALMGALVYIGQTGDALLGGGALFAMAIGMGVPLVVWGTSAGRLLPRAGAWMGAVKAVFGVGLLALAIWMLERVIPPAATMVLWGTLAIGCAVFLGALTRLPPEIPWTRKLGQALGVVLLVVGVMQFIGAAAGARDWTRPLAGVIGGQAAAVATLEFIEVHDLGQLERAIAAAARPVFLDFYADWCVDCRRMERRTFTDGRVAARLQDFELIKVDVTDYNADHQVILQRFGLIGPPAYLFFASGNELQAMRQYGFMAPDRFLEHLDRVLTQR